MTSLDFLRPRQPFNSTSFMGSGVLPALGWQPKAQQQVVRDPSRVRPRYNPRPLVLMMTGRRGSGKSEATTALAYAYRQACLGHHAQPRILSNYLLSFAWRQSPFLVEELEQRPSWGHDALVLIDEIADAVNSMRSNARLNVDFGAWLRQIRKLHNSVICGTQFPQDADNKLLRQVDIFVRCHHYEFRAKNGEWVAAVQMKMYDWWGQWTGLDYRKEWPPPEDEWDWLRTIYNTQGVWKCFDTDEEFAPLWSNVALASVIQRSAWAEVLENQDESQYEEDAEAQPAQQEEEEEDYGTGMGIDRSDAQREAQIERVEAEERTPEEIIVSTGRHYLRTRGRFQLQSIIRRMRTAGVADNIYQLRTMMEGLGFTTENSGRNQFWVTGYQEP